MFNAAKIYARQFKPIEGGYLYYPTRWSRGFFVSEAEFERLRTDWESVAGWAGMLKLAGGVVLAIIVFQAAVTVFELSDAASDRFSLVMGLSIAAYVFWRYSATYRLVRSREPIAPKRSGKEAESDIAAALSWPMMVLVCALSLWFGFIMLLVALVNPAVGISLLAIFAIAVFMNARIAFRKWADRKSET